MISFEEHMLRRDEDLRRLRKLVLMAVASNEDVVTSEAEHMRVRLVLDGLVRKIVTYELTTEGMEALKNV